MTAGKASIEMVPEPSSSKRSKITLGSELEEWGFTDLEGLGIGIWGAA